jgi:hypothetical protein
VNIITPRVRFAFLRILRLLAPQLAKTLSVRTSGCASLRHSLSYLPRQRPLRSPDYLKLTGLVPESPTRHPQRPRYLEVVQPQFRTPALPRSVRYNKRACFSKQQSIQRFSPPNAPLPISSAPVPSVCIQPRSHGLALRI